MFKKIFLFSFLTLFLAGVFLFTDTAVSITDAKNNPVCWTKTNCIKERQKNNWPGEGFIIDEENCPGYAKDGDENSKFGKCLAGSITTTQVSFGGNIKFSNIGDYIKTIYNYALVILGILAAVMIIVAGIQYVGSAGSQEMIGSAKKKIVGAVIGLALAYMSYTVLGMINPNTINLRLPQVYMIRPSVIVVEPGEFCDASSGSESSVACENNSQGDVKFFCTAMGVASCGIGDERSCPCAKAAELIGETVAFLATGGSGVIEGAAGVVARKSLSQALKISSQQISVKGVLENKSVQTTLFDLVNQSIAEQTGRQIAKEVVETSVSEAVKSNALVEAFKTGGKWFWTGGKMTWDGVKWVATNKAKSAAVIAAGGTSVYAGDLVVDAVDAAISSKKIIPGKCTAMSLKEGELCDMDKNPCAEGKCIAFPGLGGIQCWSGNSQIGVCSSGKVNSFCNGDSDCSEKAPKCVNFTSIGGNEIKACTDGSFTAPCSENSDCKSGQCGNYGYCVNAGGVEKKEGEICNLNDECNTGLACFTSALTSVSFNTVSGKLDFDCDYKMIDQVFLKSSIATQNTGEWSLTDNNYSIQGVCIKQNKEKINDYKNDFKTVWKSNDVNMEDIFITCPKTE
ncbi:MAG TPA: pilin [Candidatus Magasanikbacteria bacterium]|nr:pilin [Candidatus Magasanikbacteria bacterium]